MNIPYDEMPEKIEELMAEVERLESENKHLLDLQKSMDQQYEELENNWNELKKFVEIEKDRLVRQCSQIYEDSLGKTRLVSEDIYNELKKISDKMQEIESGKNE